MWSFHNTLESEQYENLIFDTAFISVIKSHVIVGVCVSCCDNSVVTSIIKHSLLLNKNENFQE